MKILITTDWYTPAVNGVVTSVKNLQRELERRGHEVRILTLSQNLHSWSRDGVTAIGSVDAGRIYPGARLRTAMAGRWVRELLAWRPDVITGTSVGCLNGALFALDNWELAQEMWLTIGDDQVMERIYPYAEMTD